jgi:hypothetical protein
MVPLRRDRDFLVLWSAQLVSTLGSQVSLVAFPLLVLALTGSPAKAGVVAAGGLLGAFPALARRPPIPVIFIGAFWVGAIAVAAVAAACMAARSLRHPGPIAAPAHAR